MDAYEAEVELFNPVTAGIFNIDWLCERDSGNWRAPVPREDERQTLRSQYLISATIDVEASKQDLERFDKMYPMIWRLHNEPKTSSPIIAVLDTGCLLDHPLLADCIEDTCDFTGEGIEDRIGHGTGCALLARTQDYGSRP